MGISTSEGSTGALAEVFADSLGKPLPADPVRATTVIEVRYGRTVSTLSRATSTIDELGQTLKHFPLVTLNFPALRQFTNAANA